MAGNNFWYENWNGGPGPKITSDREIEIWEQRFEMLTRSLSTSPWREKCRLSLAQYFKAFSQPNLEDSFLEGWRLFEEISGSRGEKINDKVKRAANIYKKSTQQRIVGKHLKVRRNSLTHGHKIEASDEEMLAFQMLHFLAPLLEHYILNGFRFSKQDELWEFLDLPEGRSERQAMENDLNNKLKLIRKAAIFRQDKT
ncbi:hypothetical protein [Rhodovulum sulfidophilum]|uniref:hypothetical protein n=1 Tax=Rhodovulum sulfidophilum TaxID=35806 RepID=UPI0019222AE0|nr:hypothetical protein [Rhodovulum sulfidophilum]MBL3576336.1 hypothetical protein [Rhodovulum sulfidophilum]MCE8433900.1 hypothetical protein [Rhodovulum sulfidophilum]